MAHLCRTIRDERSDAEVGPYALLPLPRSPTFPFESLVRAIAHQQLHAKAAECILARFGRSGLPVSAAVRCVGVKPERTGKQDSALKRRCSCRI